MRNKFFEFRINRSQTVIIILSLLFWAWSYPQEVSNVNQLSNAMITGKIMETKPWPLAGFLRSNNKEPQCESLTFAADFSAFYISARHLNQPDIYTGKYDCLIKTPPRLLPYPPFIFYVFNKLFCNLPFAQSVLCYLFLQVAILIVSSYWILRYYQLGEMILPVSVFYCFILFLTPVGLTWFERGQVEIYSAVSILFFMFAVYERKSYAFLLAAFFGSLKFANAFFFFQAFFCLLILFRDIKTVRFLGIFIGIILLTFIFFPMDLISSYLNCCYKYQLLRETQGISLIGRTPFMGVVPILIFSLLIYPLSLLIRNRNTQKVFFETFLPYMTALAAFDLLIPRIAYEYRTLCLLGFVPVLIPWLVKYKGNYIYKTVFISCFALFMLFAFHSYSIFLNIPTTSGCFIYVYMIYFLVITIFSVLFILRPIIKRD